MGRLYPFLNYSLFFMGVVFVALVMMNLLIALINDSYANVQSNFREYLVRERASLILEIYDFLDAPRVERNIETSRWLHVLEVRCWLEGSCPLCSFSAVTLAQTPTLMTRPKISSDEGTAKGEDVHHLSQVGCRPNI